MSLLHHPDDRTIQLVPSCTAGPTPDEVEEQLQLARETDMLAATLVRRAGRPGRALYDACRSVERQARIAGVYATVSSTSLRESAGWAGDRP